MDCLDDVVFRLCRQKGWAKVGLNRGLCKAVDLATDSGWQRVYLSARIAKDAWWGLIIHYGKRGHSRFGASDEAPSEASAKGTQYTLFTLAPFFCAYEPHSMKTTLSLLLLIQEMTASVNFSQPWPACELAVAFCTVRTALRSNTPAWRGDKT